MKLPVATTDLLPWIPHRPPMVWVDFVLAFGAEGGECAVILRPDALYMGPQGLRPSCFIEFMAQSFGFTRICHRVTTLNAPENSCFKKAFLIAIRDAQFFVEPSHPSLQPGQTLKIRVGERRDFGPIQLSDCTIVDSNELVMASAHLKVYSE